MFIWDSKKNEKLKKERGVSFEDVQEAVLSGTILGVEQHRKRENQYLIIVRLHDYVCAVPFVYDKAGNMILKTIYQSRKLQKLYYKK